MSMILQTNSSSTPVAKLMGGTGTASTGSTGTGFTQTLTYAMNGTGASAGAAGTEGQAMAGLMGSAASLLEMLQALMSGDKEVSGESQRDEKVQKVDKLLDDLLKKLQDMDASIMNDPTLVQALQSWLVQVQQVLGGSHNPTDTQGRSTDGSQPALTASLPALAQHADTLRFAVADAVSQVVEKLQAIQTGNGQPDPKLEQLMNNLQNILQKAGGEGASTSSGNDQGNQQGNSPAQIIVQSDAKSAEAAATPATATQEASVSTADNQPPTGVVTAGQLAMRAQATSLTPAQPQAPVATIPMQNFSGEMSKFIVSKFDIHQLGGLSEARIILNPEHLGQVDVKISIQDGQLLAQFITEKHGAKDALEQQMAQLRTALQAQGLQVDKLEVAQSSGAFSDMYHGGQGFESNAGQQQSGRRSKSKDEQSDDAMLTAEIGGELKEWRDEQRTTGVTGAANMLNYGSTYVAKA